MRRAWRCNEERKQNNKAANENRTQELGLQAKKLASKRKATEALQQNAKRAREEHAVLVQDHEDCPGVTDRHDPSHVSDATERQNGAKKKLVQDHDRTSDMTEEPGACKSNYKPQPRKQTTLTSFFSK